MSDGPGPDYARMSFYDEATGLSLGTLYAMQVPRVGDIVAPPDDARLWVVRQVQWTVWPSPGSNAAQQGITGPMVDLMCSPSRGVHR